MLVLLANETSSLMKLFISATCFTNMDAWILNLKEKCLGVWDTFVRNMNSRLCAYKQVCLPILIIGSGCWV